VNIVAPSFHDRVLPAMIVDIGVTVTYDTPGMSCCKLRRT